jgi:hypothetical protein
MANVMKWIQKSKNNSLQPDEEVLAALGVAVQNKVKYMAGGTLGGVLGQAVAAHKLEAQQNDSMSQSAASIEQYPRGAVIIALTPGRLLVYKLNFLGRPKTLGASYLKTDLAKAEMDNKRTNYLLTLSFKDGGTITHDVSLMQGSELQEFVNLVNTL